MSLCRRGGGFGRQYGGALIAGLLLGLPILLFVHRYIDDLGRSMDGEIRWVQVGRPLAEWLFTVLNLGGHAVAVAPLHQLLTIALVALIAVLAARVYGIRSPFWTAVATLPLLGQPYALENLSYGFDALGMFLALGLAVLAALVMAMERGRNGLIASTLLLTGSLCLYQPGTSAFLPFALMLMLGDRLQLLDPAAVPRRAATAWIVRILLSYLAALVLYTLLLKLTFQSPTSYAAQQGQLLALNPQLPLGLLHNAAAYWLAIADDWNQGPFVGLLLSLVLAYALVVWRGRVLRLVGVLAAVLLIGLLAPGALLVLEDPQANVPRMLLFAGPLLASVMLQIVAGASRLRRGGSSRALQALPLAAVLAVAWAQIVFAYAYGHAFAAQAEFEAGRLSRLVDGIARLQQRQGEARATELSFVGGMPKSPVLRNTQKKFPLVDRLVPRLINDDWAWGWKQLELHGIELDRSELRQQDLSGNVCRDPQTAECTTEYTLQIRDRSLLVQIR